MIGLSKSGGDFAGQLLLSAFARRRGGGVPASYCQRGRLDFRQCDGLSQAEQRGFCRGWGFGGIGCPGKAARTAIATNTAAAGRSRAAHASAQVGVGQAVAHFRQKAPHAAAQVGRLALLIEPSRAAQRHAHRAASYKSKKMLKIHMVNMIKYFNKWGWIVDKERSAWNRKLLEELGYKK